MKIVIAPDKFKGSLTGFEYCDAVTEGLRKVFLDVEIVKKPLADGGDGTIDVVNHYIGGERIDLLANDPLFKPMETAYVFSRSQATAFIEMAEISGLRLLSDNKRNCMHTTSLGFGELIVDAIERGAKNLILGIGGSATNDGGMGMAQALGFRFLDRLDNELEPIGSNLIKLNKIDTTCVHPKLKDVQVKVACDVSNPLYGPKGAAHIYAAQKGASKKEIEILDKGLKNYAKVLDKTFNVDIGHMGGAGAAGGMGAGSVVFLNADLVSGIDLIKDIADFDASLENADWIITGEGQLDMQTLSGKTISGVLTSAKQKDMAVAALCGAISISKEEATTFGFDYTAAISEGCKNLEESISKAYPNLVKAAEKFGRFLMRSIPE